MTNRRVGISVSVVLWIAAALVPVAAVQRGVLQAGTVTAKVDGVPFSVKVTIAALSEGTLILSNLSNAVQIQIPRAKVGKFELKLDSDGQPVDVIVGLKVGKRYVGGASGWISIESLSATAATGRFEFVGKDLETEQPVTVKEGRFDVRLTGK